MNKRIFKNYFYSVSYQLLLAIIPLITMPYKTRVLGAYSIGVYSYVYTIINYLIIISNLGINIYGRREVACLKSSEEKTKLLYELLILKSIITISSLLIFFLLFGLRSSYSLYYILLSSEVIFSIFDITWFYQGTEDFKSLTIINFIVRILNVIAIFLFIKSSDDIVIYFLITLIFDIIPIILLIICGIKKLYKQSINNLNVLKHLKPCLILFLPQICIQIYTSFDKIMLGNLTPNIRNVGYYEYSSKIVDMTLNFISSISLVMIPIMSKQFISKEAGKIKKYINESVSLVIFLAIPIIFGLCSISNTFVFIVFGKDYMCMVDVINILSFIILPIGLTTIIGEQYLIPTKQEKKFTKYIAIGAVINIILNFILVKKFEVIGVSLATLMTELFILFIEFKEIKNFINIKENIINLLKYIFLSIVMYLFVILVGNLLDTSILTLTIQIITGIIIYIILLFITKDNILKKILEKIF